MLFQNEGADDDDEDEDSYAPSDASEADGSESSEEDSEESNWEDEEESGEYIVITLKPEQWASEFKAHQLLFIRINVKTSVTYWYSNKGDKKIEWFNNNQ